MAPHLSIPLVQLFFRNIGWCESRENSHGQNFLDENRNTSEGEKDTSCQCLIVACFAIVTCQILILKLMTQLIDCPMGAVLNNQLQSVMQEGLLDSLLPYLVRDKKLYKVGGEK